MLSQLLKQGNAIEVTTVLDELQQKKHKRIRDLFWNAVEDVSMSLLGNSKPIAHIPLSYGKDSSLVVLVAIYAYAKLIREKAIEASRPLIVTTVDTKVESVPMVMMTRYCEPRLIAFARSLGVNLQSEILTPRLADEYFVRWGSAQKLLPNPTRSGDCSVILKVDVSERHLRSAKHQLAALGYGQSPLLSLLGSRDDESPRRKNNIDKAELRDNPLLGTQKVELGKGNVIYQYAPVRDWKDEEVFLFHQLAGSNPITKSLLGNTEPLFPSFFEHHGLMLAVYGNAKNEACQVVIGQTNNASCGGKSARFGCYTCTMVGNIDRSSEALALLPRWSVLGGANALAVRDYLFRLSTNMDARAYHAKAVDEVGYNRIALQPNVLKAKHLEKMVWYASMLAVNSMKEADKFKQLVAQGREMEHVGMQDIASDPTLSPRVKEQFLDMYREVAQQQLYTCFSEKHALMLSFRWLVDGVATTSFKPISIFQRVLDGEQLAWPMSNRDYEAKYGKIAMKNKLPDAVMIPFHTQQAERDYHPVKSPSFLSYWRRPFDVMDLFDKEYNCSVRDVPKSKMALTIQASCNIQDCGALVIDFKKAKLGGRQLPRVAQDLAAPSIEALARAHYESLIESMWDKPFDAICAECRKWTTLTLCLPYLDEATIGMQLNDSAAKLKPYTEKTERNIVRRKGTIQRTTTRLNFYTPKAVPAKMVNRVAEVKSLRIDLGIEQQATFSLKDADQWLSEGSNVMEHITINEATMSKWLLMDGWNKAIEAHNNELENRIRGVRMRSTKGWLTRQIRVYGGSTHVYSLMREAGIEIAPEYLPQLMKTIKRTDLFSEIGVYDYANLPQQELLKLNNIIDMKQHRKDKVACVNLIRAERNKARQHFQAVNNLSVESTLAAHLSQYQTSVDLIEQGLIGLLRGHIDTAEPKAPQLMATARMHLALSVPFLESNQECLKRLLNSHTLGLLNQQPERMVELANVYTQQLTTLSQRMVTLTTKWRDKLTALYSLLESIESGTQSDHNALWQRFQHNHNQDAQQLVTFYPEWRAARQTKVQVIGDTITHISKILAEIEVLNSTVLKSIANTGRNTVDSLSTKSRLKFLSLVA